MREKIISRAVSISARLGVAGKGTKVEPLGGGNHALFTII